MKQDVEARKRSFPWRACFFFLLFIVGAVLMADYQKHGSIQRMRTNVIVRNSKVFEYGQNAWAYVGKYTNQGLESIENNYPEQYKYASEQSTTYSKLFMNLMVLSKNFTIKVYNNVANYIATKQPIVVENVEHYAPGLIKKVHEHSTNSCELMKKYYGIIGEQVIEHSTMMIRWMEMNVFVGKLNPENLQNYASKAVSSMQTFASQTYDWVYEKVQTFSNIQ